MTFKMRFNQSSDIEIQKEVSAILFKNKNILLLKFGLNVEDIVWNISTDAQFMEVGITNTVKFRSTWGQLYLIITPFSENVHSFIKNNNYPYHADRIGKIIILYFKNDMEEVGKILHSILREI